MSYAYQNSGMYPNTNTNPNLQYAGMGGMSGMGMAGYGNYAGGGRYMSQAQQNLGNYYPTQSQSYGQQFNGMMSGMNGGLGSVYANGNSYSNGYGGISRMAGAGVGPSIPMPNSNPLLYTNNGFNLNLSFLKNIPKNLADEWNRLIQRIDLNTLTPTNLVNEWNNLVAKFPEWKNQLTNMFQNLYAPISNGNGAVNNMSAQIVPPSESLNHLGNLGNNLGNLISNTKNNINNMRMNMNMESAANINGSQPLPPLLALSPLSDNGNIDPLSSNNTYKRAMKTMNSPVNVDFWPLL